MSSDQLEGLDDTYKYSRGVSQAGLNVMKGLWYGGILSVGTSLARGMHIERDATPLSRHISPDKAWGSSVQYFKTGAPMIMGTMAAFFLIRDKLERSSPSTYAGTSLGLIAPLGITALPAIGYAAATRRAPPEAAVLGLAFSALAHGLDRLPIGGKVTNNGGWRGKPM